MKNFYKRHFYSIPEAYLKLEDIDMSFYDIVRVFIITILLIFTIWIFLSLVFSFVSWEYDKLPELLRWTLVLIFLYFIILKKNGEN